MKRGARARGRGGRPVERRFRLPPFTSSAFAQLERDLGNDAGLVELAVPNHDAYDVEITDYH